MCTVLLGLQRLARVRPAQFTAALGLGLASDEAGGCVGRSGCEQGVLGGHPVWVHVAWWPRRCWAASVAGRRSTRILCGSSTGQLCAGDGEASAGMQVRLCPWTVRHQGLVDIVAVTGNKNKTMSPCQQVGVMSKSHTHLALLGEAADHQHLPVPRTLVMWWGQAECSWCMWSYSCVEPISAGWTG